MGTSRRLDQGELDAALDSLLTRGEARVTAIGGNGLFLPLPPGLPLAGPSLISGASSALDLVVPQSFPAVIEAWEEAARRGIGRARVRPVADPAREVALHFVDARHRVGVYVGVLVEDDRDPGDPQPPSQSGGGGLVRKNAVAVFVDVDEGSVELLGWTAQELVGMRSLELVHPDDQHRAIANWMDLLAAPGGSRTVRLRHRHRDGSWVWLSVTNTNHLDDPEDPHVLAELLDVSSDVAARPGADVTEVQQLASVTLDGLLRHCDAVAGAVGILHRGRRQAWAERDLPAGVDFSTLTALAVDEVTESRCPQGSLFVVPVRLNATVTGLVALVRRQPPDELTRRMVDLVVESLGAAVGALRSQEQLVHAVSHDGLTGLINRDRFLSLLRAALLRGRRTERHPGVLVLDVDGFDSICESHGPLAGDRLLLEIAARLQAVIRAEDTAARCGDDGFAVLVEQAGEPHEAAAAAERLRDRLHEPVLLGGRPVSVTVSIGVAVPTGGTIGETTAEVTAESLLRQAEAALGSGRREGPARIRIFDPSMQAEAERRAALKALLAGAVDRGELGVVYQPIVDIATRRVAGVEALLRWSTSQYGVVSPLEFIPLAEQTGMIHSLGQWVLRHACEQARVWALRFPAVAPYVSVNLSALQVQDEQLPSIVSGVLATTRLPADHLVLELTESVFLRDTARVLGHLHDVRGRGVRLALDDFGTGYSSLSYLQRFRFDLIKLDKSFIDHLGGTRDNALVKGVLGLTRALSIATVAEGVEQVEQARELAELRCEYIQGYLFSRPVSPERIEELLRRGVVDAPVGALVSGEAPA